MPQSVGSCGSARIPVKIGTKVVSHGCYVTFQPAEVAIPRHLLAVPT
jgi:hypothetical protein